MSYELNAGTDSSCQLIERAAGTTVSNSISIPQSKDDVLAVMKEMLRDENKSEASKGCLTVSRMRDKLKISSGIMNVELPWNVVFALVLEDA